ncbi:MAG: PolC-type DNA polymerase III [Clostridia bacterium]|nr:PolC-type DNA polymerase III [Clostridia bacterium]
MSKTLEEAFTRFEAPAELGPIMRSAVVSRFLFDREKKIIHAFVSLPDIAERDKLRRLENGIAVVYELSEMRIFPQYPKEKFSIKCLSGIIDEVSEVNAVARGFFENAETKIDGNTVTIVVPYGSEGVGFINHTEAAKQIKEAIFREFSLDFNIKVQEGDVPEDKYDTFFAGEMKRIEEENVAAAALRIPVRNSIYNAAEPEFSAAGTRIHTGFCTFDTAEKELIFGEDCDVTPERSFFDLKPSKKTTAYAGVFVGAAEEKSFGKNRRVSVKLTLTDYYSSVTIKAVVPSSKSGALTGIKSGTPALVCGKCKFDEFENEIILEPETVYGIKQIPRTDDAEEKRVELHLHTTMSAMDGFIEPKEVVKLAKQFGHKAIAITDHGNVQAFPMVLDELKGTDLKIIYGMEGYFVDDTARAVFGASKLDSGEKSAKVSVTEVDLDSEFCVFDIETTGLSPFNCHIIEIGAVNIKNGVVTDRFDTFVDPGGHIPDNITALTGIDDGMVCGAPSAKDAVTEFLRFAAGKILVAHNASFDISFIRKACDDYGIEFNKAYLDTLSISRFINPELKNHKLDTLVDFYQLGDFQHHRACDDAEVTGLIFSKMAEKLRTEGIKDVGGMETAMRERSDPLKLHTYHQVILVRNLTGLKNLYKLVSRGYINYFSKHPRIPKTLLSVMREGLLIGSACQAGELFSAMLENRPHDELVEIANFYDYLEIQPVANNRFLVERGTLRDDEAIRDFNRRIVALGEETGKPVVATCDAHYLNEYDDIYRRIILAGMKMQDGEGEGKLYVRTTEEMLEEFSYLGSEKAYEVVVTNTNKIADMIEVIRPYPDGTFPPDIPGSAENLQKLCMDTAVSMYGDPLPGVVADRLKIELDSIIKHGFAVLYIIAHKLVKFSEDHGYLVGSRGSVGSSFAATMAGITEVNPLPPHYYCKKCRFSEFITDGSVGSGFDLPDKKCPKCGEPLSKDGHDIPFQTFLGFDGDKSPDIDLNFSGEVQALAHKYTEELFGKDNVFRAGTIQTLQSNTAFGFVKKYVESKGMALTNSEINRLVNGCIGAKRSTGQHPGGIVVVPRQYEVYDFTPVQYPADDVNSGVITTHFAFSFLHDTLLKLDMLGHDVPTKYKFLEEYSGIPVTDVPLDDPNIYKLFKSPAPLGVTEEQINCQTGTLGLPEMGTSNTRRVLIETQPKNFADLVQVSGLTHGTDVWSGNAQDLIKNGVCDISQVVGTRDSIMLYLIGKGLDRKMAFGIMEKVRKGKGVSPEYEEAMLAHDVPEWYIESCKKIKYMFPKAHAAAYVISALRLGWYKIYRPLAFYAAYFSAAPDGLDGEIVVEGIEKTLRTVREIEEKGRDATQRENETYKALSLAAEMMARGIRFLPVDLYKSDAKLFLPENDAIRLPFSSLSNLGTAAAASICEERKNGKFYSVLELSERTGITKAVVEVLRKNGIIADLPETDQISLFSF